ncbi:MAG TPA: ankyrin repeat domain-containing protein [Nitrososphaera sp.]|nr:ankyrin repeat domain-containing protein [Nitrososphaera sp.]
MYYLVLWLLVLNGCEPQQRIERPNSMVRSHLEAVAQSLPKGSSMRQTLLAGKTGSGERETWMERMKRLGVRVAFIEIRGVWRPVLGFRPESVERSIYRKNYDGPEIQITDVDQLSRIQQSNLEAELQTAAFKKAKRATWFGIDTALKNGETCFVDIYLYDDEWLADDGILSDSPGISRYDPRQSPLHSAVAVADSVTTKRLLAARRFTNKDLDSALFRAVDYSLDNKEVILMLLKAGANVNAERPDGTTPLMDAAAKLNLNNVQLLLASGADAARQNTTGSTAYLLAKEQNEQIEINKGRVPDYAPGILDLVSPHNLAEHSTAAGAMK